MRNNFHYGFGTRLTAVILTLLMVLSLGGFVLRDTGMGVDEPMIFDESYGTPAPEATEVPAETAAPEATEAPAEDTPAPEATEAPAEATPVPETDSGTDTNMSTSEPAATPDPQDAPAPETEATAAPEGDMPADEMQMDEIMTIANAAGHSISVLVEKGPGEKQYTLTITNTGADYTAEDEEKLKVQFESPDTNNIGNCQATTTSATFDGVEETYDKPEKTVDLPATFKVAKIILSIDPVPSTPVFKVKLHQGFLGKNQYLLYTDAGTVTVSCYNGTFPGEDQLDRVNEETAGGGTEPAPGPAAGEAVYGRYNLVYHMNIKQSGDEKAGEDYVVEYNNDSGSFTLKNIGQETDDRIDGTVKALSFTNDAYNPETGLCTIGGAEYVFAGWSNTVGAKFSTYAAIDYPAAWVDDLFHSVAPNVTVTVTEEKTVSGEVTRDPGVDNAATLYQKDLYAVWAPRANSALYGYTMYINTARFEGIENTANKTWTLDGGQVLGYNGHMKDNPAMKYTVLDGGWTNNKGGSFTVTSVTPVDTSPVNKYTFIGWFDKNGAADSAGTKFFLKPGATRTAFGDSNDVYSLDALWGRLSPAVNTTYQYTGDEHSVLFDTDAETKSSVPKVVLMPETYSSSTKKQEAKDAFNNILKDENASYTIKVTGETDITNSDGKNIPQKTASGQYTYNVSANLKVDPALFFGGTAELVSISSTEATLTILPRLTLNVHKIVDERGCGQIFGLDDHTHTLSVFHWTHSAQRYLYPLFPVPYHVFFNLADKFIY